jgi:hypothetical protein
VAIVLVGAWLIMEGWCWGRFARGNTLLQYLYQCRCPAASEPARYPAQVQVLVPACRDAGVGLSPGGQVIQLRENGRQYLLDPTTLELSDPPTPYQFSFISDNLLLVSPPGLDRYLLDRNTLEQTPLVTLYSSAVPGVDVNGSTDPIVLLPMLRSAAKVYVDVDIAIALHAQLGPDTARHDYLFYELNWIRHSGVLHGQGAALLQFLISHQIPYTLSARSDEVEWLSHSGAFVARTDGIYLAKNGQRIVESYYVPGSGYLPPIGWVSGDRGVILKPFDHCVIETYPVSSTVRVGCVHEPVLLLKVPPQYLP